ncbi:hypothetical protein RND71_037806 [Anisodus tanguticus]|uniref:Uncharacterized protein n=1 Tax=Anisodus tanguticus TaxID=243964 RepID=A0AAE1QYG8_9SOLA|nr:hypothetical protein RND71_037806 [Anisodus tanguticus]
MAYYIEEEAWKCPKHPLKKRRNATGVCSICLRDRLSKLCPHCANVRPCSNCAAAASTTSSVKLCCSGEPAFCRSKSVGIPFLKSRNVSSSDRRNPPESEKSTKTASSSSSGKIGCGRVGCDGDPAFLIGQNQSEFGSLNREILIPVIGGTCRRVRRVRKRRHLPPAKSAAAAE